MKNAVKNDKVLLSEIIRLINERFEKLGTFLADLLLMLEVGNMDDHNSISMKQVSFLIHQYAEYYDSILNICRLDIEDELERLLFELERLKKANSNKKYQNFELQQVKTSYA